MITAPAVGGLECGDAVSAHKSRGPTSALGQSRGVSDSESCLLRSALPPVETGATFHAGGNEDDERRLELRLEQLADRLATSHLALLARGATLALAPENESGESIYNRHATNVLERRKAEAAAQQRARDALRQLQQVITDAPLAARDVMDAVWHRVSGCIDAMARQDAEAAALAADALLEKEATLREHRRLAQTALSRVRHCHAYCVDCDPADLDMVQQAIADGYLSATQLPSSCDSVSSSSDVTSFEDLRLAAYRRIREKDRQLALREEEEIARLEARLQGLAPSFPPSAEAAAESTPAAIGSATTPFDAVVAAAPEPQPVSLRVDCSAEMATRMRPTEGMLD